MPPLAPHWRSSFRMINSSCVRRNGTWTDSHLGTLHPSSQPRRAPFRLTSTTWSQSWSTQSSRRVGENALTSRTSWKTWNCAIKGSQSLYFASSVTPCLHTSAEPGPSNQNEDTRPFANGARSTYLADDRNLLLWRHGRFVACGAIEPHELPANLDLEQFRTIDQAYLSLPAWTNLNVDPPARYRTTDMSKKHIVDMPEREFHPKSYLNYLCDPTLTDRRRRYRETVNGMDALKTLDWESVVSSPPRCPFLHAFLDDLGEALNRPLTFIDRLAADQRARFPGPTDRILRNL